jgi:hypothetical protein
MERKRDKLEDPDKKQTFTKYRWSRCFWFKIIHTLQRRNCARKGGTIMLLLILLHVLSRDYLWGGPFDIRGGLFGAWADAGLRLLFSSKAATPIAKVDYPHVVLRSSRKEIPGYSLFLEELLSRAAGENIDWDASEVRNHDNPRHAHSVVNFFEGGDYEASSNASSDSVIDVLAKQNCQPRWLCQRCLNAAQYGSLTQCRQLCPECLEDTLCQPSLVRNPPFSILMQRPVTSTIPRIVHMMWHEPLDSLKYPELVRIQNGWRSTDFSFRFYTPDTARRYIQKSYPLRIIEVYDSIQSLSMQINCARVLILLREGGVFANVDLLLEVNLEVLLVSGVSFFAAREDDMEHCLWTGLVGASPGHVILVKEAEEFLTRLSTKGSYFDIDRSLCTALGPSAELWKARVHVDETTIDSCALGRAVHTALGERNSVMHFSLGKLQIPLSNNRLYEGDALILLMSKSDTGATRISDIERNILIASTSMVGLSKESLYERIHHATLRNSRAETSTVNLDVGVTKQIRFIDKR